MFKNKKIIIGILAILLVLVAGIGLSWYLMNGSKNSYYAVYLDTGDLYFGKISWFPSLTLSNVWYIQRDPQSQNSTLLDFSKVVWGPQNVMKINRDRVVWMAKLSETSPILTQINSQSQPSR